MKLSELIWDLPIENRGAGTPEITDLTNDTRRLVSGALFAAIEGTKERGADHIREALEKGAAAVLCRRPPDYDGPWLVTDRPRRTYGLLCRRWFGNPGKDLTMIGVTGTNGKTTTTYLMKWVPERMPGTKVGLIGTIENIIGDTALPAHRTTPDAYELYGLLARMKAEGCTHAVMEVSSHALTMDRTAGLWFRAGIFTNLTRDHLDFHETMATYYEAKSRLFLQCQTGIFNLEDPAGRYLARTAPCEAITWSLGREADLVGKGIRLSPQKVAFTLREGERSWPVEVPIPGRFTVCNAMGVLACCHALGLDMETAAEALRSVPGVKGRAELVPVPAPFTVVIDYAHTPDALENILMTLREGTAGRLLCLFGCGGDRDRTKRPIMGEIAGDLADLVILTSDNPRTEDPEAILDQIVAGFTDRSSPYIRDPDRRSAIRQALGLCRAGDVLLLAGKGHETVQDINGKPIHFDEREEISFFFEKNTL